MEVVSVKALKKAMTAEIGTQQFRIISSIVDVNGTREVTLARGESLTADGVILVPPSTGFAILPDTL